MPAPISSHCKKIHISFFGGFGIRQNGEDVFLRNKKAEELLVYLALTQSGKVAKKKTERLAVAQYAG